MLKKRGKVDKEDRGDKGDKGDKVDKEDRGDKGDRFVNDYRSRSYKRKVVYEAFFCWDA
ncbi:hypothetical protein [Nostoc spongiaeforme]|uniref:hypothetical protein n=1 Tax=Nostoc spongiaeforme TaxID=502487 RepID=UPI001A7E9E28|nr:hypothetical protein [Nostoc spongiaeforme]